MCCGSRRALVFFFLLLHTEAFRLCFPISLYRRGTVSKIARAFLDL